MAPNLPHTTAGKADSYRCWVGDRVTGTWVSVTAALRPLTGQRSSQRASQRLLDTGRVGR